MGRCDKVLAVEGIIGRAKDGYACRRFECRGECAETAEAPGGQGGKTQDHADHTQDGHNRGGHANLALAGGVNGRGTDRGNHQAKAKTSYKRADGDLCPVDIEGPEMHQPEANSSGKQAKDGCQATGDTGAQPAAY